MCLMLHLDFKVFLSPKLNVNYSTKGFKMEGKMEAQLEHLFAHIIILFKFN
jgi:hypothetical protein